MTSPTNLGKEERRGKNEEGEIIEKETPLKMAKSHLSFIHHKPHGPRDASFFCQILQLGM